jgi:hypothetical protein
MSALFSPSPFSFSSLPPIPSSTPYANALAAIFAEAARKPRNRSEWEARFVYWQKPASDTEEQQTDTTAKRIARAMRHSAFLPHRQWRVVKQGSKHNNTNVRSESDVDLGVCLTDAIFYEGPPNDSPTLSELANSAGSR